MSAGSLQLAGGVVLAGGDSGRASPIGLFVILALCVAVYFLWKSLNRHLKRVPESFEREPGRSETGRQDANQEQPAAGPDAAGRAERPNDES